MNPFDLPPRRYAYDEIAAWPDEARRELDDGTPTLRHAPGFCPALWHAGAVGHLMLELDAWSRANGGTLCFYVDWQLDAWNSVAPDLCFFARGRRESDFVRADGQCLVQAPDLIIEVWDARTRDNDLQRKPALYARHGAAHYWIVDPVAQTLEAFELSQNRYALAGAIGAGETYAPAAFAELVIVADALFPGA